MKPDDQTQQDTNYWQAETSQPPVDTPGVDDYPQEEYQPVEEPDKAPIEASEPADNSRGAAKPDDTPVAWVAKEYQVSQKNPLWYVVFGVVVLALLAVAVLFFEEWSFAILIVVIAIAVVVHATRPPADVQYTLSARQGLYIGERLYHLSQFKKFGLLRDNGHNSIVLVPVKRFAPGVSVFFPDDVGERIVDILGQRLPMETIQPDLMDKFIKKINL